MINWKKINDKYKGLWVLLDSTETKVLFSDSVLKLAIKKADLKKVKDYIIYKVPQKPNINFIGSYDF